MSGGLKDDALKIRYDLVPAGPLHLLACLYTFGGMKYTRSKPILACELERELVELCSCQRILNQQHAIQDAVRSLRDCADLATINKDQRGGKQPATLTDSHRPEDSVGIVTIKQLKQRILNMLNGKEKIVGGGSRRTLTELKTIENDVHTILSTGRKPPSEITVELYTSSDYRSKMLDSLWNKGVASAEEVRSVLISILTTIIQLEDLEASSAENVIKDLDLLEILRKLCLEHSNTCSVRQLEITGGPNEFIFKTSGADNWRKGISYRRLFGAMQRHAWDWFRGRERDPETGLSDLVAVAWCAFSLIEFEMQHRNAALDDRYKPPHDLDLSHFETALQLMIEKRKGESNETARDDKAVPGA